jgi:lysozyme
MNLDIIKEYEGLRLKAYQDTGGVWTIGYGHTLYVKEGDECTLEQAESWLEDEAMEAYMAVLTFTGPILTMNMRDALTSFVYNVGIQAFKDSTLLKKLNNNDFWGALMEFPRWNKDNGVEQLGLTKRRIKEQHLFIKKD